MLPGGSLAIALTRRGVGSGAVDQELRNKVPTKSASAKKPDLAAMADHETIEQVTEPGALAPDAAPVVEAVAVAAPDSGSEDAPVEAPATAAAPAAEPVAAPAAVEAGAGEAEPEAAAPVPANDRDEDEDEDDEDDAPAAAGPRGLTAANDAAPPLPRPHHSFGGGPRSPGGGRVMPPPRPMAKAELFVEGDHVVYPTHGVGKVERIATEEIAGHKLELIHITFEENRMTLRVPVAKARSAGLRKLATRKMFDEALAVLKGRARIKRTMWSRRAQEYEAKINSGDPLSIAEVVRDLHRNSGQPDQSFSERQIYEAAMDRLAAELAALDKIDKAAAATKLVEFLKTV
jgi:CarD family transcriptional regulator